MADAELKQTSIPSEDESDSSEQRYEVPALQTARTTTDGHTYRQREPRRPLSGSLNDDISNHLFMSDPSVSEDGDESSAHVIRAPHRAQLSGRPMHFHLDDCDAGLRSSRRAPTIPTSPGNTSLSSWDTASPATKKRFLFHSFPDRSDSLHSHEQYVAGNRMKDYDVQFQPTGRSDLPRDSKDFANLSRRSRYELTQQAPPDRSRSSDANQSTGRVPWETRFRIPYGTTEFSRDLSQKRLSRQSQRTAIEHLPSGYQATAKETYAALLEKSQSSRVAATGSGGPATVAETSIAIDESVAPHQMDDSIAMTLSDDSDPQEVHHRTRLSSLSMPDRCETHNSFADDERTDVPPVRPKRRVAPTAQSHKRSRSGDTAAAKLTTGTSWKGMEQDRIPLPSTADDDDDPNEGDIDRFSMNRPRIHLPIVPTAHSYHARDLHARSRFSTDLNPPAASAFLRAGSQPIPKWPGARAGATQALARSHHDSQYTEDLTDLASNYSAITGLGEGARSPSRGDAAETKQPRTVVGRDRRLHERDEDGEHPILQSGDSRKGTYGGDLETQILNQRDYSGLPDSPFANFGKISAEKAPRWRFLPSSFATDGEEEKYQFYTCPRCRTRQREFFTVSSAPSHDSGPSSYLALYFALYVTASLFIFGLEEGWEPLDCIYFAVITLTTCGLGDLVPTTPANKLICSLFIYFGVACIGLLLGTYIAGLLDDKASRDRKSKQMESCPYCKQVQTLKETASRRPSSRRGRAGERPDMVRFMSERNSLSVAFQEDDDVDRKSKSGRAIFHHGSFRDINGVELRSQRDGGDLEATTTFPCRSNVTKPPPRSTSNQSQSLLSPVTRRILGRQGHTRHESIDLTAKAPPAPLRPDISSKSNRTPISEATPLFASSTAGSFGRQSVPIGTSTSCETDDSGSSSEGSDTSDSTVFDIMDDKTFQMRAAKYVFLTIRQALVNSLVIIAFGCLGFWFIEGFPVIDSWYFTTVLLTTTGYGDVVPYTRGGKLFATVYLLVAGTILLNNMSMISMIPLELRRRRIERAVLTQFGNELDDAALRELATGPTIQRLRLATNRPDGLNECTREMFSLAMLVRLGKVTEDDIKETFAAFRRLDVNDEGVLNSKSIIAAMIHRRRSRHGASFQDKKDSSRLASPPPPPPPASRPSASLKVPEQGVEQYNLAAFP